MRDEVLKYVPKPDKKARKRAARARGMASSISGGTGGNGSGLQSEEQQEGVASQEETDRYHPVRCQDCNTEIAVMDSDEVFHFFNVLPSASS